ncbi:hypothetical protein PtB15_5B710 [Puccinia triticina]|nr:hypothetical protein PtB15_5B710 [Puccinia triticina]
MATISAIHSASLFVPLPDIIGSDTLTPTELWQYTPIPDVLELPAGPILPIERRLAEIAELIPISLLHVDAINQAKSRRGDPLRPAQVRI